MKSGASLHVGHPLGYTGTDILARFKHLHGFNLLHPMGWDVFGLPVEQYEIERGIHQKITIMKNINWFRSQLKLLGFSYDWDHGIMKFLQQNLNIIMEAMDNLCSFRKED